MLIVWQKKFKLWIVGMKWNIFSQVCSILYTHCSWFTNDFDTHAIYVFIISNTLHRKFDLYRYYIGNKIQKKKNEFDTYICFFTIEIKIRAELIYNCQYFSKVGFQQVIRSNGRFQWYMVIAKAWINSFEFIYTFAPKIVN